MATSEVENESLFQAIDEGIQSLGKTNIIVVGRSGAGKSTLINAIFKKKVAETNDGLPVTQNITEYAVSDAYVILLDTRGLEMEEYETTVKLSDQFIKQRKANTDRNQHIHVAWICISDVFKRIEKGEIKFIEMVKQHMPVIIVMTQCYGEDDSFVREVKNMFQELKVISVIAQEKSFRGVGSIPVMGLEELTKATEELLPEAHRIAFIAAQKVDLETKKLKSHGIVATAAGLAVAACAIPIPFADSAMLAPIQATMITAITAVFGFKVDRNIVMTILGIWGTSSCMTIGEAIAANLLKLIPGVGSVAGAAISASVATTITTTFGEAYISILIALFNENNGEQPTAEQLLLKCKQLKNKEAGKIEH